ncbi:MAG: hypothetical protein HRU11_09405 [Parvularculaceae bacterium]|nr:hypothetical protein [Parvularculaceae bacterium]
MPESGLVIREPRWLFVVLIVVFGGLLNPAGLFFAVWIHGGSGFSLANHGLWQSLVGGPSAFGAVWVLYRLRQREPVSLAKISGHVLTAVMVVMLLIVAGFTFVIPIASLLSQDFAISAIFAGLFGGAIVAAVGFFISIPAAVALVFILRCMTFRYMPTELGDNDAR